VQKTVQENGGIEKFYTTRVITDISSMIEGLVKAKEKHDHVDRWKAIQKVNEAIVQEQEKLSVELVDSERMQALTKKMCATQ
jgi:hypothetical protein